MLGKEKDQKVFTKLYNISNHPLYNYNKQKKKLTRGPVGHICRVFFVRSLEELRTP